MWKIGVGWTLVLVALVELGLCFSQNAMPRRILLDTDVDTDDLFALLYLLKLNSSQINLKAVTVNTNGWSHAGHAVNQIYDILYMMDRDDVRVGVGGEGGILLNGSIQQNVGGYLPIIEQEKSTVGGCRYRQAIPLGHGGMLDIDTNYGLRKSFLPQGTRRYSPLQQPTVQQVMIDTISKGATTVILLGTHTNFAIFLMNNPHLKKNIDHIYVMGGGVRAKNPSGCCPTSDASCMRTECGDPGNLFTAYTSNPYAEFNIFGDPFAAYKVFHSGIPITLVPLDATNTIPITEEFFTLFERRQDTYEAQYVFQSLKLARDTLFSNHDQFFTGYFMWDSFAAGIAASIICNPKNNNGENKFAEMEYMNITVITSNEPYGVSDGSNPFFDGRATPRFNLKTHGVHSGHVQTGIRDPFCFVKNSKGRCQDGYTKEVTGPESVRVLVATKAKPNQDVNSKLDREFYQSFLEVLNSPSQTGRFNFTTQFPYYKETMYKLDFGKKKLGKPLVFDMDMSAGDFLALIYLLKVPVEVIDLKGILVTATGWTNAAAIDIVYDVLHMMGRDDIPVGLGEVFAIGQVDCKYIKAIPHGSGGQIDSDTLYGLARTLPRSPRRYTSKNLAPGNIAHPELRQPLALEVWQSITESVQEGSKVSILSNGPLSNLAQIILSNKNTSSVIENIYVVGGNIRYDNKDKGNVFTVPSNKYSEFNILLDPYAAKIVLESGLDITLIPLSTQRQVSSFPEMIRNLGLKPNTPEAKFSFHLLSHLYQLQKQNHRYQHMDIFLGEILGAVIVSGNNNIEVTSQVKSVIVTATRDISVDGQILIDEKHRSLIKIIESVNHAAYYQHFAETLGYREQSAKTGSCHEQRRIWSRVSNFDV